MAQRKVYDSIVFLKESEIKGFFKDREVNCKMFIIDFKIASDEALRTHQVKIIPINKRVYEFKWRLATKKEFNAAVKKHSVII